MGGSNLYTSASDFIVLLKSLLRNDGKLLKPETVDLMLDSRLKDNSVFKTEKAKEFFEGSVEEGMELDHCLAGLVNLKEMGTGRKVGGVSWSGATRCYWVSYCCPHVGMRNADENSGLIEGAEFVDFTAARSWERATRSHRP